MNNRYSLILYDTSDFEKFPIGGQLTSIRNFLRFVAEYHTEFVPEILLVGITTEKNKVGKLQTIDIAGCGIHFMPVMYRSPDLSAVQSSLRLEYLKALCKMSRILPHGKNVIHYLHTPEAFIYLKAFHPLSKTAVFSHGSFFNMVSGFRFYQNSKVICILFNEFLKFLLRKADLIFTLDETSTRQYIPYNKNIIQVENSIVLPKTESQEKILHNPVRMIFVGRLSKVKQVDAVIKSIAQMDTEVLTIVGDGEEKDSLQSLAKNLNIENRVNFTGAVDPDEVGKLMQQHDILVMNSTVEGKPMAIIEAMGYGLPVVTTPVGGIPEMVIEMENAIFTDGSCSEIRNAVVKVADNYSKYSNEAFKGSKKFDYRIVNNKILASLTEL